MKCRLGYVIAIIVVSSLLVFFSTVIENLLIQGIVICCLLFGCIAIYNKFKKYRVEREDNQLIEMLPVPVVLLCRNTIWHCNRAAIDALGANSKKEIQGRNISDFIYLLTDMNNKEEVITNKQRNGRGRLTSLKGRIIDIEVVTQPYYQKGKSNYLMVLTKCMEQKEDQEKLQQYEKLSVLGELAAGIAHEIRNPITSLKGFLQLIESSTSTNANSSTYTKIMLSEIDRINMIVSELLILGKPKELKIHKQFISEILETVVTLTRTQAILYNIEIHLTIPSDLSQTCVSCDENKLKQVFINIIKNAIEAMKHEGAINVKVALDNGFVVINIIDQGEGIPKEKLLKLGRQFFSTKENGTGLGLMISSTIIEEHGGKIHIESEEGKGTTVKIMLPISK
ncbi:ATP-binding protein [Halalkalibacter kiskunsagensis]|uniref:histidine kinase n=1 Tax=Halalkalibacter kiskunsagensis TaxID=1548599 RepID=A0ABV6KCT3_9BACI